ncbi:MAG: hypothetical protein JNM07_02575 [Phycisphaerae bacterium]|nr:hypothetical protein [Phycisphaerae bacterium]
MHARILDELRRRELVRSSNNPVADLAELVASRALGLTLVSKSSAGHDAVDAAGNRYQVKGRRVTAHNKSRQLSFIRGLESKPFDSLVGILFDADFRVTKACVVPIDTVRTCCAFVAKVNGHRFLLRDAVWKIPGVKDVTEAAKRAACELGCD